MPSCRVIWIKALYCVMAWSGGGRQHLACSEILVGAEIEPRRKKKRCLQREIKDLKGERIHLRFCELAINLAVRFFFFHPFHSTLPFFSFFRRFPFCRPKSCHPLLLTYRTCDIAHIPPYKISFILSFSKSITCHYYFSSPFNFYFKSNLILNSRNISYGMSRRQNVFPPRV